MTRKNKKAGILPEKMGNFMVMLIVVVVIIAILYQILIKEGNSSLTRLSATTKVEECRFMTGRLTNPQDSDEDGLGDFCDPCVGTSPSDGGENEADVDQDNLPSSCDHNDADPEDISCKGFQIALEDDKVICCTPLFAASPGTIGAGKTCQPVTS